MPPHPQTAARNTRRALNYRQSRRTAKGYRRINAPTAKDIDMRMRIAETFGSTLLCRKKTIPKMNKAPARRSISIFGPLWVALWTRNRRPPVRQGKKKIH